MSSARELDVQQAAGRQVDRDGEVQALLPPLPPLPQRFVDHVQGERTDQAGLLSEGDERVRIQQPALGVLPPDQRLDGGHVAVGQRRLGLVVQDQLPLGDGPPQLGHESQAVDVVLVRVLVVLGEVGVVALAVVHGDVGSLDQDLRALAVLREDRYADRRLDRERESLHLDGALEQRADALDDRLDVLVAVKLGEQQPELVAAEARDGVRRANCVAHAPAHFDQQLVAGRVAQRVVDLLEAIEVHQRDREQACRFAWRGGWPDRSARQTESGWAGQ